MKSLGNVQKTMKGYEAPTFERHRLAVITLGGSPLSGDSGAPTTRGNPSITGEEKSFEESWDNEV